MPRLKVPAVKIGDVIGHNTVVALPERVLQEGKGGRKRWTVLLRCNCGHERKVSWHHLMSGEPTVGCSKCIVCTGPKTHGQADKRVYSVWQNMKSRCFSDSNKKYADYGGRGITVCEEWRHSFSEFWNWAQTSGYQDHLEIDRIDNNGNYEPRNCRWVTRSQNVRNTRVNRLLTAFGETKCITEWTEDSRCKVGLSVLRGRIRIGWSSHDAISRPARPLKRKR